MDRQVSLLSAGCVCIAATVACRGAEISATVELLLQKGVLNDNQTWTLELSNSFHA